LTDEFAMTGGPRELTGDELDSLVRLRAVVLSYHQAGLETAPALREIRDRKLWRGDLGRLLRPLSLAFEAAREPADQGRRFEGVQGTRIEKIAGEVTAGGVAEVIPLRRTDLIEVRDREGGLAIVTLSESGFLRLLDRFDSYARKIAQLIEGPAAMEKAVAAIPQQDAAARIEQIDRVFRVAGWLMAARLKRWPQGPAYGQESWALRRTGNGPGRSAARPAASTAPTTYPSSVPSLRRWSSRPSSGPAGRAGVSVLA
jgi:hypothetical protein